MNICSQKTATSMCTVACGVCYLRGINVLSSHKPLPGEKVPTSQATLASLIHSLIFCSLIQNPNYEFHLTFNWLTCFNSVMASQPQGHGAIFFFFFSWNGTSGSPHGFQTQIEDCWLKVFNQTLSAPSLRLAKEIPPRWQLVKLICSSWYYFRKCQMAG